MGKRKQQDNDDGTSQDDRFNKPRKPILILHGPKLPDPHADEIAQLKAEEAKLEAMRNALLAETKNTQPIEDAPDSPPPGGYPPSPPGSTSPPGSPAAPLPKPPSPRSTQPTIAANFGAPGWSIPRVSQPSPFHLMTIRRSC